MLRGKDFLTPGGKDFPSTVLTSPSSFTPLPVGDRCILVPTPTRSRQAPKVCLFLEFSISKIPDPESYPPSWPLSVRRGMFFFPVLIYSSMPVKSRVEKRVLFVGESLGHPDNKQGQARSWPLPHPSLQIAHCPHFCVPSQLSSVSVWRLFSLDLKKKKKLFWDLERRGEHSRGFGDSVWDQPGHRELHEGRAWPESLIAASARAGGGALWERGCVFSPSQAPLTSPPPAVICLRRVRRK